MSNNFDRIRSGRIAEKSGLFTGAGAGASFFQFRNAHASLHILVKRIEIAHLVTTGYTAAQEVGYHVVRGTAWSVAPTGGTGLTLTSPVGKLDTTDGDTILTAGDVRIATTGALTDGTVTADAHLLGSDSVWSLAGAAGAALGWQPITFEETELGGLLLRNNEGFLAKSTIAQGAAGVGRWFVNVTYLEGLAR